MKSEDLLKALSDIDDRYIEEADPGSGTQNVLKIRGRTTRWSYYVIAAAAVLLVLGLSVRLLRPVRPAESGKSAGAEQIDDAGTPLAAFEEGAEAAYEADEALVGAVNDAAYEEDTYENAAEEAAEEDAAYETDAAAGGEALYEAAAEEDAAEYEEAAEETVQEDAAESEEAASPGRRPVLIAGAAVLLCLVLAGIFIHAWRKRPPKP